MSSYFKIFQISMVFHHISWYFKIFQIPSFTGSPISTPGRRLCTQLHAWPYGSGAGTPQVTSKDSKVMDFWFWWCWDVADVMLMWPPTIFEDLSKILSPSVAMKTPLGSHWNAQGSTSHQRGATGSEAGHVHCPRCGWFLSGDKNHGSWTWQ
jgi:hypothetical protein